MTASDEWLDRLLEARARGAAADAAGPCPENVELAGLIEDRLLDAEREALLPHLAGCDACMDVIEALVEARDGEAASTGRTLRLPARPPPIWLAVAAAVLVLTGAGIWLSDRSRRVVEDAESELIAAVRGLAERQPLLFETFEPLGRAERLAPPAVPTRAGGLYIRTPRGLLYGIRPIIEWDAVPGVSGPYRFVLRAVDEAEPVFEGEGRNTRIIWRVETTGLRRGVSYIFRVAVSTPLGERSGQATFGVLTDEQLRLWQQRLAQVEGTIAEPLRHLVRAHVALRAGILSEAENSIRAYVAARPRERVGLETLYCVLRLLERPDAEAHRPPATGKPP